jgi:hypothetical protein
MTQIEHSRHRSVVTFLVNFIAGLIAITLVALWVAPGVSPTKPYRTSWIGNTFSGGSKWVQNFIDAMYVAPDGTIYTNSEWDEGGREAGIYKDGDVIGMLSEMHGWGRLGGEAVTANNKYIYVAMIQGNEGGGLTGPAYPPRGSDWYCVRRYDLKGKPAPFSRGRGHDQSMLIVSKSGRVTGLANAGRELYVSDNADSRIRVYNTDTMAELRNWTLARPRQIAVDGQGNLWIIQAKDASHAPKILHYSKTGKLLSKQIMDVVEPTALAVDNQGRLLVAENGLRQQVLIYNIAATPKLVGTLGTQGGIYSGRRGEVRALKFYGLTGVGTDTAGNVYVNSNGFKGFNSSGTDLRKFSTNGALQWSLVGLEFVDNADADPTTDAVDVFTKHERFLMKYSKGKGKEWTYKAYTVDKFRYPDDARLQQKIKHISGPFVRRIRGKRFLYLTTQMAERLFIYRFDGEIAVPCGMFSRAHVDWPANQPAKARWMWRDRNGDGSIQNNEYENLGAEDDSIWGWEVDSKGDIWQASESGFIRHYRCQGLDAYGSPIYTGAASEVIPMPALFKRLERIEYFPNTDVMYLGGYTVDHPRIGKEWGIVGTEIVRYDNWSTKRNVRWRVVLPYDPSASPMLIIKAMDVAKDRIFAVTSRTAEVYVYDAATGASVTKLAPGPEVAGESGWIDIPYGLRAHQRANGEYLVFVEEDSKAKIIMYRIPPQRSKAYK